MVENGNDYCILCTFFFFFLQLILSCNAAFIQCVNYSVCPVDPDKLMMSNVYMSFFICDVYLSKVSSNETEMVDLSVCLYSSLIYNIYIYIYIYGYTQHIYITYLSHYTVISQKHGTHINSWKLVGEINRFLSSCNITMTVTMAPAEEALHKHYSVFSVFTHGAWPAHVGLSLLRTGLVHIRACW